MFPNKNIMELVGFWAFISILIYYMLDVILFERFGITKELWIYIHKRNDSLEKIFSNLLCDNLESYPRVFLVK